MIVLFCVAIFGLFLYLLYEPLEKRNKRRLINKLPGPFTIPVLGSLIPTIFVKRTGRLKLSKYLNKTYGTLHRIWILNFPTVHISNAADTEVVLSSSVNIDKARMYNFFKPWLGAGLLISGGQKWHERRKMLTPAFHFSILESFFDVFVENSDIFVNTLQNELGKTFDMFPYVSRCALDIICESAMGVKVQTQTGFSVEYLHSVKKLTEIIIDRILYPWLFFRFIYRRTQYFRDEKKALAVLHEMSNRLIAHRKEQRKINHEMVEADDELIGRKKKAFLDLLLDISEESLGKLTDNDIREEVDTFMFEGHDTTSAALAWTIYLLGRHPDEQEKVYEELQSVFSSADQTATMKDMSQLKYLECVIKETLRLFPSVPYVARKLSQDIKLSGYDIPKGTTIIIHVVSLHQQQDTFPNPEQFNPSNFAKENSHKRHPFSYVPFSAGPRNCIGQKFAMLELKVVLSTFFRKYKVEAIHNLKEVGVVPDTIIRPKNGVHVKITERC